MSLLFSPSLERALRFAADRHRHQTRKGGDVPYITHPVQVAWILQRVGFDDEPLLIAALLHDVLEDCGVTRGELDREFSPRIGELVGALSERKRTDGGQPRPWEDRKREHLLELSSAGPEVQALTLADKLHNLATIAHDLQSGMDLWSRFNAPRDRVLWYYDAILNACSAATSDARLATLHAECRHWLTVVSDYIARGQC
ncbi:MAG: HD domain-containing protein [Planctomycetaceae bacterium]